MGNIAIIPARGNSKRIPRKNIKDFLGKPIIAYSIETALQSGLFDEVMVSTDDPEIANIAETYGAKVPFFRSDLNSGDFSTTVDVLLEVLAGYQSSGKKYTNACCLYPTAPFVTKELLEQSYIKLTKENLDCVFPVIPYSYPVQRGLKIVEGKTVMVYPENKTKRSQDLEVIYHDAGQFYFFQTETFLMLKELWTNNTGSIIISELDAQDIDTNMDWMLAEIKYKLKHGISG